MKELTLPELYQLTDTQRDVYKLVQRYNIPVSKIRDIDITSKELDAIDQYLTKTLSNPKNAAASWRVDSFWSFAEKFTKDRKEKEKAKELQKPFYDIMFDHYRSLQSWSDDLEAKRNRLVTYLYKGFPRKEHRAKVDTQQNREYIEYIVNNHSTRGPSGRSVFAVFEDRIQALINDGVFTEGFLKHLAVKDEMLLWHVLDFMYPPSHDKGGPYHVVRGAK